MPVVKNPSELLSDDIGSNGCRPSGTYAAVVAECVSLPMHPYIDAAKKVKTSEQLEEEKAQRGAK